MQYLNNVLEQDHRTIKRRVRGSQHFRSFWGSGQGAEVGLLHRLILGLFAATN